MASPERTQNIVLRSASRCAVSADAWIVIELVVENVKHKNVQFGISKKRPLRISKIRSGHFGQTIFEYFPEILPTCLPTTMALQPLAAVFPF